MTLPAGSVGNVLPIEIVNERWYSPQLKVVLLTRQSDPRFGETTYRLTNIDRSEPPADLFRVPDGFKTEELKSGLPEAAPAARTIEQGAKRAYGAKGAKGWCLGWHHLLDAVAVEVVLVEDSIQSRVERMRGAPRQFVGRHPHRRFLRVPSSCARPHRRQVDTRDRDRVGP